MTFGFLVMLNFILESNPPDSSAISGDSILKFANNCLSLCYIIEMQQGVKKAHRKRD